MSRIENPRERRTRRKQEKEERAKRYPGADLKSEDYTCYGGKFESGVLLQLDDGDASWLRVHAHGKWPDIGFKGIMLRDICSLSGFIRALVARYNALVDEANSNAAECAMKTLHKVDDSAA